jgi:hypothetical protein
LGFPLTKENNKMSTTTFSGPVVSQNGFATGTSASPLAVTTAQNIDSAYATTSATTGDTRLSYERLTFTSTGSGETVRAFSVVTGAGAAAAGTINGAHISTSVNTTGTISGAANAIRATLGGSATTPGGTLAVLQLDTDFASGVTLPGSASFIRVTDSGAGTGKVTNLFNLPSALVVAETAAAVSHTIKIMVGSTPYYLMVSDAA